MFQSIIDLIALHFDSLNDYVLKLDLISKEVLEVYLIFFYSVFLMISCAIPFLRVIKKLQRVI
jgi:hypothetical protein